MKRLDKIIPLVVVLLVGALVVIIIIMGTSCTPRVVADDGPRSFHTLDEFYRWRANYPADLGTDCDKIAETLSALAARDGFLLGYAFVPYTGVIDGIRVFDVTSWESHLANLVLTDTSLHYWDDKTRTTIYITERD